MPASAATLGRHEPRKSIALGSYQLRIALRRTSPHVWHRVLVPCQWTMLQLHQTLRALFGWSEAHPHRFLIRGKSFATDQTSECEGAGPIPLSDFQFYVRERFFYDYRFELQMPVWGHESRMEKMLPVQEKWRHLRCIAGAGSQSPEPVAGPQEFHHMLDLFTPRFYSSPPGGDDRWRNS